MVRVPQKYRENPLLLLVAARRADRQIGRPVAGDERWRERDARTHARTHGRGMAVLQPADLAARRYRKAEARDDRRALQPAAAARRRDHVARRIDDIEMHGIAPFGRQRRKGRLAGAWTERRFLAGHR